MVQKILVVGHPGLAEVIGSQQVQIVACPEEMSLQEAVQRAGADGSPPQANGLVFPWDVIDNSAEIAGRLAASGYPVVVVVDDPSVNLAAFQGVPVAGPDSTVDSLVQLLSSVMGVAVFEVDSEPPSQQPPAPQADPYSQVPQTQQPDFPQPDFPHSSQGVSPQPQADPYAQPSQQPQAPPPPSPPQPQADPFIPQQAPQAPPQVQMEGSSSPEQGFAPTPPESPVASQFDVEPVVESGGFAVDDPYMPPQTDIAAGENPNVVVFEPEVVEDAPWEQPPAGATQGDNFDAQSLPQDQSWATVVEANTAEAAIVGEITGDATAPQQPDPFAPQPQNPQPQPQPQPDPYAQPPQQPQAQPPQQPDPFAPQPQPQTDPYAQPPQQPDPFAPQPHNPQPQPQPQPQPDPYAQPPQQPQAPPPASPPVPAYDPFAQQPQPDNPFGQSSAAPSYGDPFAPQQQQQYGEQRHGGHGPSTDFSAMQQQDRRIRKAQVHTFAVPKGGTGKSSLAAIYAAVLSQGLRSGLAADEQGPRVLLIDANVQQADSRRIMGLRPQRTMLDLARTVFDETTIESYLTPPSPANPMWLLAGPVNKAEADPNLITPALYRRVTDLLLRRFDHIVIDTPEARLFDPMLADYAMPITDWLIVPVLQNRPVLDGTKEWLELIQAPRHVGGYAFDSSKVRLVMNMARESIGYTTETLSVDLAAWEFAGEVAYSDQMARATNEYRLPLDDANLVNSVRRVIYSVTGNPIFNPVDFSSKKGKKGKRGKMGAGKGKGQGGSGGESGVGGFIKKMMS